MKTSVPKLHSVTWKSGIDAPNVTHIHEHRHDKVTIENVFARAINAGCYEVFVCGYDRNEEFYMAASTGDLERVIYMLELAKRDLLSRDELTKEKEKL